MAPPPEMPMQQMAQGGLAELDVGDMFNEQSYADGGIVAFADGGDTEKGMNLDNLPSLNLNTGESMSQNIDPIQLDNRPYDRRMEEYLRMAIPGFDKNDEPRYTNAVTAMYDHIAPGLMGGKQDPNSRPANAMNAMVDHMVKKSQGMAQEPQEFSNAPATSAASYLGDINTPFMAQGGPVRYAEGGDTEKGMNLDNLPSLNLNTGTQGGGGGSGINDLLYQINDGAAMSPVGKMFLSQMSPSDRAKFLSSGMGAFFGVQEVPKKEYYTGTGELVSRYDNSGPQQRTGDGRTISQGMPGMAQGGEVKRFVEGGPSVASLKYQAALADSYLDPRYLVSGAQDLVSRNLFGYRVVRDPVTGELIQAKDLPSSTDALRKKKKSEVEELLDKAEKIKEVKKSEAAKKENLTELDPTLAAATFSRDALYKDPNMSELYNMTKPRIPALPEKGKVPPNATQEFNPYANVEKPKSTVNTAEETAKRFQEMMGADPERETLMKKVQDLELGSKEQERMAPWLALTKAGFGIAAGKSPFALQNIGEGAQLGISEYVAARDRLDKLNERQLDIRAKLNQVQRGEKAAGVSAGLTKELKQMEEDNANARNAATNQVQLKTAAIAAAKKSDYETYLSIAQQDPDNYKLVKNPETGESTKVFDAPKVTQAYKSFSGSSGLDDDKLLPLWQQEKMMDKNFKMSFQEYANMMRSKLGGTTQSATPTKTLNNIFK
jgi:hypothetical protein